MPNGLSADRVLLVFEGEGYKGGPSEIIQGYVGCSKAAGFDEKSNVHHPGGVRMRVISSLEIFSGPAEEEEPKV